MANQNRRISPLSELKGLSASDRGLMGRLTKDPTRGRTPGDGSNHLNLSAIAQVLKRSIRNSSDYDNIFKILPVLKLPREILLSSILSPGDLVKQEVAVDSNLDGLGIGLKNQLVKIIRKHFLDEQNMASEVGDWLDEALITRGSHPVLILPEASLDKMMRRGKFSAENESIFQSLNGEFDGLWYKPKGILGRPTIDQSTVSFEGGFIPNGQGDRANLLQHTIRIPSDIKMKSETSTRQLNIVVTDNLSILRRPAAQAALNAVAKRNAYGAPAFEAAIKKAEEEAEQETTEKDKEGKSKEKETPPKKALSSDEIYANYFKPASAKNTRMMVIPTSKLEESQGMGHPIVYHLPPECVVPVFTPGDVKDHKGYFIALDSSCYPANYLSRIDYYNDIRASFVTSGSGNQSAGALLNMAQETQSGSMQDYSDLEIERMQQLHTEIIERELISRVASGIDGEVSIGQNQAFNKMMFARDLKGQRTVLLYVPADMMIYMAFEYTPFGVGKSILEDAKEQIAVTANLKIAQVLQQLKNAIPGKNLTIKLDPDDPSPLETVLSMINQVMTLQFHHYPTNMSSTADIASTLQQTAWNIQVTGNENFPDMSTEVSDRERPNDSIDTGLYDSNLSEIYRVFGTTPEMVDGINQPEFATTAVQNSVLLRKRVVWIQSLANPFLSDYIRLYTMHSGPLTSELMKAITGSKDLPKEYRDDLGSLLLDFINSITCKLPEPIIDDLQNKSDLVEKFTTMLDKMLEGSFSAELLQRFSPELAKESIDTVKASIKAKAIREFCAKHGILTELDIFTTDEEGNLSLTGLDDMINHLQLVTMGTMYFLESGGDTIKGSAAELKRIIKSDQKTAAKMEEIEQPEPEPSEGIVSTDDETEELPPDGSTGDDDDLDADLLPEETPPEEEEEEDSTGGDNTGLGDLTPPEEPAKPGE